MKKNYTLFSVRTFRAGALSEQIREHDLRAITVLSERRASQDASSCSSDMCLYVICLHQRLCTDVFPKCQSDIRSYYGNQVSVSIKQLCELSRNISRIHHVA